jgi:hypothetical protein
LFRVLSTPSGRSGSSLGSLDGGGSRAQRGRRGKPQGSRWVVRLKQRVRGEWNDSGPPSVSFLDISPSKLREKKKPASLALRCCLSAEPLQTPEARSGWCSGWAGCIRVSEPGGPLPLAVGEPLVGPAVLVFDAVIVAAQGCQVAVTGLATSGHGLRVIDVALS